MLTLKALRKEIGPTLHLATPLVLAEIGWMVMGIVDTIMVGHLPNSAVAIGAVSLGSGIFTVLGWFGGGILLGLDTLVSQAFGAGKREDCHRSMVQGIYLSLALTPLLSAPVWLLPRLLRSVHVDASVLSLAIPYTKALTVGLLPLLLYFVLRRMPSGDEHGQAGRFCLGHRKHHQRPLQLDSDLWTLGRARDGNGRFRLVHRHRARLYGGRPRWLSSLVRPQTSHGASEDPRRPRSFSNQRLLALGLPAALQITLETGVFATVTTLIAKLGAVPLASHQIALNTVSLTFMVPLGISSAAAVRVGQALGRKDPIGARDSGSTAIALGAIFMACCGVALIMFPRWIARMYTPDENVIAATVGLLAAGAAFQLFDGIQTVATGALRGAGDTRTPMLCHFLAYWVIGLPLGAWLCFRRGLGAIGLWIGLSLALILIGIVLLLVWRRTVEKLAAA